MHSQEKNERLGRHVHQQKKPASKKYFSRNLLNTYVAMFSSDGLFTSQSTAASSLPEYKTGTKRKPEPMPGPVKQTNIFSLYNRLKIEQNTLRIEILSFFMVLQKNSNPMKPCFKLNS